MPRKGFTWGDEQREKYYSSPSVKSHMELFAELAKLPKTPGIRQKMSEAKQGVPKTDEHKKHMAETQRKRHALFRTIKKDNPLLTKEELWDEVRARMNNEGCTLARLEYVAD